MDDDYLLALQLQTDFLNENEQNKYSNDTLTVNSDSREPNSLVDPYWEVTDPNPDIRALFLQFNERFFWGRLSGIEVKWSPRMTLCAGLCCYEGRGGLCSVRLSVPLLKLRPRKDLVETLLHEMIHAYLFVTDNNKDHDGHGPEFHKHMYRINKEAGTNISVYHNFHDEVDSYRQHWWRCDGPCRSRKPYFGYVKRSMNRAPSSRDTWWAEHQRSCGGKYTKVKEPDDYGKKKSKNGKEDGRKSEKSKVRSMDIRIFAGEGKVLGAVKTSTLGSSSSSPSASDSTQIPTENISSQHSGRCSTSHDTGNNATQKSRSMFENKVLPGGKTPEKNFFSNKPVSQGGLTKFGGAKKKKNVIDFDWSDSEDDEILANLSAEAEKRLKNETCMKISAGMSIISSSDAFSEHGDMPSISDQSDVKSKSSATQGSIAGTEKQDASISHVIENSSNKLETSLSDLHGSDSSSTQAVDTNDVRAMLRKVWGEKQFNKGNRKTFKAGAGSVSTSGLYSDRPVKRLLNGSTDADNVKRLKSTHSTVEATAIQKTVEAESKTVEKLFNITANKSSSVLNKNTQLLLCNSEDQSARDLSNTSSRQGRVEPESHLSADRLNTQLEESGNSQGATQSQCPVCCTYVPAISINEHLDLCLQ